MIVDASAVLSIVFDEPDALFMVKALRGTDAKFMSSVNFVEAAVRADSAPNPEHREAFDRTIRTFDITVADVSARQADLARDAYRRFGRGNHPARLNLGDCFAFALARSRREPLLFKGDDFAHPDILSEIDSAL